MRFIKQKYYERMILIFSFFLSFALLAVCSESSPLYPMNIWVDPHCFFTLGKGILNGMVPYRDLYEQKGPLIYFLHAGACLISEKTFFGVYLLEGVAVGTFFYYMHKTISLYCPKRYSIVVLPLIGLVSLTTHSFCQGDSAEELLMPFTMMGIYYIMRYFKEDYMQDKPMSYSTVLLNGVFAGCVLWAKYAMLGFWFGWMAFLFLSMVVRRRFARALNSCFVFLGGMLLAGVPWLIYFAANNALDDFFHAYFYVNLFSYSEKVSFIAKILSAAKLLVRDIMMNQIVSVLAIGGIVSFFFRSKRMPSLLGRFTFGFCAAFLILGIYFRGVAYGYYFYTFVPFTVFGVISILDLFTAAWNKITQKRPLRTRRAVFTACVCLITVGSIAASYVFSENTYLIGTKKEDLAQYRFAEIINQTPNATMLNYGFLDGGFYFAADIMPTERYFCKFNLLHAVFPEGLNAQNECVRNKAVDYIVTIEVDYLDALGCYDLIEENYDLVEEFAQLYEMNVYNYRLYKVKA